MSTRSEIRGDRRAVRALFFLVALLLTSLVHPNEGVAWQQLGKWPGGATIELELGIRSSALETEGEGTSESELRGALSDWQSVECAELPASYVGESGASPVLGDGKNTLSFVQSEWPYDSTVIGFTAFEKSGAYIHEADVVLNEANFHFVTRRGALPEVNARSILLHELGHVFGLGHSSVASAAMNANYVRGLLFLSDDDMLGLRTLFPASECTLCESDDDCPYGHRCTETGCTRTRPPSCLEVNNCARDEYCAEASGNCVRGNVSPEFLGTPCETENDCEEGIACLELGGERLCTIECDAMNPRSCPHGFLCDRDGSPACGIGHCAPGTSAGGALATPCEDHADCGSLRCVGGLCSFPCETHVDCPNALLCHPDRDDGCGACAPPLGVGERCLDNAACESGLCVELEEAALCSKECTSNDDCPSALRCRGHEGVNLCLPAPPIVPESGCGCDVASSSEFGSQLITTLVLIACAMPFLRRRRTSL